MPTQADLGRMIKAKHPEYHDMDDAVLGASVQKKFPGAYDDFVPAMHTPSVQMSEQATPATVGSNLASGIASGFGNSVSALPKLIGNAAHYALNPSEALNDFKNSHDADKQFDAANKFLDEQDANIKNKGMANSVAEGFGKQLGEGAGNATQYALGEALPTVVPRAIEHGPAAAKAVGNVAKDAVTGGGGNLANIVGIGEAVHNPSVGIPMLAGKAALGAVKGGNLGKAAQAVGDMFTRPTTREIIESNSERPRIHANIPPAGPDVPVNASPIASDLPSGRKAGGIQNQEDLGPGSIGPRAQPVWNNKTSPTNSKPGEIRPIFQTQTPSGRRVGGIQNQSPDLSPSPIGPKPQPAWRNIPDQQVSAPSPITPVKPTALPSGRIPGKPISEGGSVQAGKDSTMVKGISNPPNNYMNAQHEAMQRLDQAITNKTNIIKQYAKEKGINLKDLPDEQWPKMAQDALDYGKTKNWENLPKSGKYRGGISPSTIAAIRQGL